MQVVPLLQRRDREGCCDPLTLVYIRLVLVSGSIRAMHAGVCVSLGQPAAKAKLHACCMFTVTYLILDLSGLGRMPNLAMAGSRCSNTTHLLPAMAPFRCFRRAQPWRRCSAVAGMKFTNHGTAIPLHYECTTLGLQAHLQSGHPAGAHVGRAAPGHLGTWAPGQSPIHSRTALPMAWWIPFLAAVALVAVAKAVWQWRRQGGGAMAGATPSPPAFPAGGKHGLHHPCKPHERGD